MLKRLFCLYVVVHFGVAYAERDTVEDRSKDWETINRSVLYGISDKPYTFMFYLKEGNPSGSWPDLIAEIFHPLAIEPEFRLLPNKRIFIGCITGQIAITSLPVISGYESMYRYPSEIVLGKEHLYSAGYYVFGLRKNNTIISSLQQLTDLRVGALSKASFLDSPYTETLGVSSNIMYFPSKLSLVKGLLAQRIDVILATSLNVQNLARDIGVEEASILPLFKVGDMKRYLAYSKTYWEEDVYKLRDEADKRIKLLRENGMIQNVIDKHAKTDITLN